MRDYRMELAFGTMTSVRFVKRLIAMGLVALLRPAGAQVLKHEPEIPARLAFVRTLDLETFAERTNTHGLGAQSLRLRTRYLDPDVDAFVGLVSGLHHFNQDLRLSDPASSSTSGLLWNWGADIGIRRKNHLWELDLMGAVLSDRLGFASALVGEHSLGKGWTLYHRTEVNLFTDDAILDADQGFYWKVKGPLEIAIGYRWFTSLHMDRSGPHLGIRLLFTHPKIPFLFPSLG
jgi:hypothetical protein